MLFSHSIHVQLFMTPWTAAFQASLSFTNSWSLLKFMSVVSVMPSNHLILCPPLLLLPSIFPSIRVFSNESALRIKWPKYLSFSFSTSPSNEYSGLISFRIGWFDLLAVQGNLKSLLQVDNSHFPPYEGKIPFLRMKNYGVPSHPSLLQSIQFLSNDSCFLILNHFYYHLPFKFSKVSLEKRIQISNITDIYKLLTNSKNTY